MAEIRMVFEIADQTFEVGAVIDEMKSQAGAIVYPTEDDVCMHIDMLSSRLKAAVRAP